MTRRVHDAELGETEDPAVALTDVQREIVERTRMSQAGGAERVTRAARHLLEHGGEVKTTAIQFGVGMSSLYRRVYELRKQRRSGL